MEQGKEKTISGKQIKVPKEDWIVILNTHEAIISQADFDIVAEQFRQSELERRKLKKHKHEELPENILKGMAFCAECGRAYIRMAKTKPDNKTYRITYVCMYCNLNNPNYNRKRHYKQDELFNAVYAVIRHEIDLCDDICGKIKQITASDCTRNKKSEINSKIQSIQKKLDRILSRKLNLYNDLQDDNINESEYRLFIRQYDDESVSLLAELDRYTADKEKLQPEFISRNRWLASYERFIEARELTREVLDALVERIEVGVNWSIEIKFRFRDEYHGLPCRLGQYSNRGTAVCD